MGKRLPTPAYPVVSATHNILGFVGASTTTACGDLKQPDKQKPTRRELSALRGGISPLQKLIQVSSEHSAVFMGVSYARASTGICPTSIYKYRSFRGLLSMAFPRYSKLREV